jgi:hypothetical protein
VGKQPDESYLLCKAKKQHGKKDDLDSYNKVKYKRYGSNKQDKERHLHKLAGVLIVYRCEARSGRCFLLRGKAESRQTGRATISSAYRYWPMPRSCHDCSPHYREVAADQSSGSSKNACMMIVIIYSSKNNKLLGICQPSGKSVKQVRDTRKAVRT